MKQLQIKCNVPTPLLELHVTYFNLNFPSWDPVTIFRVRLKAIHSWKTQRSYWLDFFLHWVCIDIAVGWVCRSLQDSSFSPFTFPNRLSGRLGVFHLTSLSPSLIIQWVHFCSQIYELFVFKQSSIYSQLQLIIYNFDIFIYEQVWHNLWSSVLVTPFFHIYRVT